MTTTTQQLADALRDACDGLELFADSNNTCADALTAARAALSDYNDAARPLEVGDRVRVLSGGYLSVGYCAGSETIVRQVDAYGYIRCRRDDCNDFPNGLTYAPGDLVRIP